MTNQAPYVEIVWHAGAVWLSEKMAKTVKAKILNETGWGVWAFADHFY